jgi:PKHD-type hydroxylase
MIFCITELLTPEELATIRGALAQGEFVDGKLTAGWSAQLVKQNSQMKRDDRHAKDLYALIGTALRRSAPFQQIVFPKTIHSILFSRYEAGMTYGRHVDNPIMGSGDHPVRSDVSWTLFLNEPAEYDGGELVVEASQGQKTFKLEPGALVVYPSTTLHQVMPVTRGQRLVAVGWVQSIIRDPADRELLSDLDTARRNLFNQQGKTAKFDLLAKCYANLLRKWAEL